MHLVEGTLSTTTTLLTTTGGLIAYGAACYGARKEMTLKRLPSLAMAAGLVFLAQALNVATGFGFSGHLIGGALLAIMFGPWSAMLPMGLILGGQAVFLGDGSISTLGANFLNMGLVASWVGYACYKGMDRLLGGRYQLGSLGVAAYVSTVSAALSLSLQLGYAVPSLLSAHMIIGFIEAGLSMLVFALCVQQSSAAVRWKPALGLAIIAFALLPLSSEQPDGMEHSLEQHTKV